MKRYYLWISLGILTLYAHNPYSEDPSPGTFEVVAELPMNPGNLALTSDGRIFGR